MDDQGSTSVNPGLCGPEKCVKLLVKKRDDSR